MISIEFLYLDLSACSRCRGTDENLRKALDVLHPILEVTGVDVQVRKIRIESEEQARALSFLSSPTIRVNGHDIAGEIKESTCGDCTTACQCGTPISCRVWIYHEQEYTRAPVGLIVESILSEIFRNFRPLAPEPSGTKDVPVNLKRYFAGQAPASGSHP